MTLTTVRGPVLGATLILTATMSLVSCSGGHGSSSSDQQIAASCPDTPIASTVAIDATGSYQSEAVQTGNLKVIAGHVRRTAICGGHLKVFGFASSTGATAPLFDGELRVSAPTENAELRKAGKLADQTMATITEQYDQMLGSISGTGTDVLGMLMVFEQTNAQFSGFFANNVLLSDGMQNVGFDAAAVSSPEAALELADQQRVPDLSGAELTIVGIGRQAQGEIPSSVIENVTAFWERVCENTNARACSVSTDGR